jgi:CHAD domain-containing protein
MSDEPALRPGLAVGEALRAIARAMLADARAAIDDPARSEAEAVHDFRREMKRWRALLRLLDPFLGDDDRRLRDDARDLARELGGARDAQSALDALADLADHGLAVSARTLATLRARIDALRQAAEASIVTPDMRLRIANGLDTAATAVEHWPVDALTFAEIAGRLARGYRGAQRAVPESWPDATGEALHELRKRIVIHRYQMETVAPLWRRFGRMWIGEAQRLRERLGTHQDLLVLARLTDAHQPLAHWRSRMAPAIAERQAVHVAAARRIATRLLVEKPNAFRRRLEAMWDTGT